MKQAPARLRWQEKIEDPKYELRPAESSTEGIEIIQCTFKTALRVKQDGRERLLERDFRINIWDFGGQEVYHATHQFFLTRRSLYVLVADDRKEDTDFNYWLQVVELLSDGSPLLIVQNEKQDRRRDINLGSLRARFPNLKDAYRVNLADNRGLEQANRGDPAGIGTSAPYRYAVAPDMEPCAGCVGKGRSEITSAWKNTWQFASNTASSVAKTSCN